MAKLISIATALPQGQLEQQEACRQAAEYNCSNEREIRVLQKLYQKTTIESRSTIFAGKPNTQTKNISATLKNFYPRPVTAGNITENYHDCDDSGNLNSQPGTAARMARYKLEITPLASRAAAGALEGGKTSAREVGNLVTVSCTGFYSPGFDSELIETLSMRRDVSRTHVGFMGCHGALNGLRAAAALADARQERALVVAAELCSLHFQYGKKSDDLLANALFADGAAAVLLVPSSAPGPSLCRLAASASYLVPDSREAMTWEIGDHGFQMTLSPEVPGLIKECLAPWLSEWLAPMGQSIASISSWAVHPGGPRILDAAGEALNLPSEKLHFSREIFARQGNMSSPTILFILKELLPEEASGPTVALAFGPGLTIEAALFI